MPGWGFCLMSSRAFTPASKQYRCMVTGVMGVKDFLSSVSVRVVKREQQPCDRCEKLSFNRTCCHNCSGHNKSNNSIWDILFIHHLVEPSLGQIATPPSPIFLLICWNYLIGVGGILHLKHLLWLETFRFFSQSIYRAYLTKIISTPWKSCIPHF